jgi:hypothetical protein
MAASLFATAAWWMIGDATVSSGALRFLWSRPLRLGFYPGLSPRDCSRRPVRFFCNSPSFAGVAEGQFHAQGIHAGMT